MSKRSTIMICCLLAVILCSSCASQKMFTKVTSAQESSVTQASQISQPNANSSKVPQSSSFSRAETSSVISNSPNSSLPSMNSETQTSVTKNFYIRLKDYSILTMQVVIDGKHQQKSSVEMKYMKQIVQLLDKYPEKIENKEMPCSDITISLHGGNRDATFSIAKDILQFTMYTGGTHSTTCYKFNEKDLSVLTSFFNNLPGSTSEMLYKKPVIYLYPQTVQDTTVRLNFYGRFTCTYPAYQNGWNVTAYPGGKLINKADGQEYNYLYWEGTPYSTDFDVSKGSVIKGADTVSFLQKTLKEYGLKPSEYNDFIVFWLPYMQNNAYNLISFQAQAYENIAKLEIHPKPDSILRVFMTFKALDKPITIKQPDSIKPFKRTGFTVVEWGGTEVR